MKDLNTEPNAPYTTNDAPSFTTTAMISALQWHIRNESGGQNELWSPSGFRT